MNINAMIFGIATVGVFYALIFIRKKSEEKISRNFEKDLLEYFSSKEGLYRIDLKNNRIDGPDSQVFGLENVYQRYRLAESPVKKLQIFEHFESVFHALSEMEEQNKKLENYEYAKNYLKIRVYPEEYFNEMPDDNRVYSVDFPRTRSTLVYDFPDSIRTTDSAMLAKWNISSESAIAIALENTINNCKISEISNKLPNGALFYGYTSEEPFTVTHLLRKENFSEKVGKYGFLAAIPTRQTFLLIPINDETILEALPSIYNLSSQIFEEGPGSVQKDLYLNYENQYYSIEFESSKGNLSIKLPDEFSRLLSEIKEKQASEIL